MIPSKPIVKLLGTSHIATDSVKKIKNDIKTFSPNFICVELDRNRAMALMSGVKSKIPPLNAIFQLGLAGYLFSVIGGVVQRKLGHIVGMSPGADMKSAIVEGSKFGARIVLVDRDIRVTLRRFSKLFIFREKMRFVMDIIFPWRLKRGKISFNLSSVPKDELIKEVLGLFSKKYPGLYKALIVERNEFMVKRIEQVAKASPGSKILVVIGAGHKEGMLKLLESSSLIELSR